VIVNVRPREGLGENVCEFKGLPGLVLVSDRRSRGEGISMRFRGGEPSRFCRGFCVGRTHVALFVDGNTLVLKILCSDTWVQDKVQDKVPAT
jgi:hypothetical protein